MTANMILATRPVILEQWAGGLDRVYELHKWIGAGIVAAVLLHSQIGFEQVSGVLPPGSIGETAAEVGELVLWPFVALLMLSLIKRIPRLPFEIPYNLWRWSHRLMGLVFVALAFHQLFVKAPFGPTDLISQWMIVMALVGTLAFLWTQLGARFRTRRYSVAEVEHLPGATRVRAEPAGRGIRPRAGQFAFLSAARAGLREPHPFTVSAIGESGAVEFCIRPSGDFTRRLRDKLKEGDRLRIEGGYGTFRPQNGGRKQIWIAGGIGITPFLAAAEALRAGDGLEVVLIHAVRDAEDAVGAERLKAVAAGVEGFTYRLHDSATQGRLTGDGVLDLLPFDLRDAQMWFCGPAPLRKALLAQFKAAGRKPRSVHFERFEFR